MATTTSRTNTITFARISIITIQFRQLLRRTTHISESTLNTIEQGIENQWIGEVNVYGFDWANLCCAQLKLEVHWDQHHYQLSCGRATVSIDDKWKNNTAIEVEEAIREFNKFVQEKNLTTDWSVAYTPSVYNDPFKLMEVRNALGFTPMKPVKWAEEMTIDWSSGIPEIPELNISMRLLDF